LFTHLSQQKPTDEYSKVAINRLKSEVVNAIKRFKNCCSKFSQTKVKSVESSVPKPKLIVEEIPQEQQVVLKDTQRYSFVILFH